MFIEAFDYGFEVCPLKEKAVFGESLGANSVVVWSYSLKDSSLKAPTLKCLLVTREM